MLPKWSCSMRFSWLPPSWLMWQSPWDWCRQLCSVALFCPHSHRQLFWVIPKKNVVDLFTLHVLTLWNLWDSSFSPPRKWYLLRSRVRWENLRVSIPSVLIVNRTVALSVRQTWSRERLTISKELPGFGQVFFPMRIESKVWKWHESERLFLYWETIVETFWWSFYCTSLHIS